MGKISLENMGQLLREKRGERGMRETAQEIGISLATLSRVESGKLPDIETFKKLCNWLEIDAGEILGTKASTVTYQQQDMPTVYFRADKNLSPNTVNALAELIVAANSLFSTDN